MASETEAKTIRHDHHVSDRAAETITEFEVRRLPGVATYTALAVWVGVVMAAITSGVFEQAANPPIALMASVALPVTAVAVTYRVSPRFRGYLLALDLRLVLATQLWRVVGIAFLFALAWDRLPAEFAIPAGIGDIATGVAALAVIIALGNATLTKGRLYAFTALGVGDFLTAIIAGLLIRPPELDLWPLIIFPTLMVPFFAVLHLVSVLQSRNQWDERVNALASSTAPSSTVARSVVGGDRGDRTAKSTNGIRRMSNSTTSGHPQPSSSHRRLGVSVTVGVVR